MCFWRRDTAGQERYASLAPLYYRGASAAAVVYDITSADSFQKAKHWVSELQKNASGEIGTRTALGARWLVRGCASPCAMIVCNDWSSNATLLAMQSSFSWGTRQTLQSSEL